MRIVIQRVTQASVSVSKNCIGQIGKGLLLLAGFEAADTEDDLAWISKKTLQLRIFDDENGVMNRSIEEVEGTSKDTGLLIISQFTLHAATKKGNRPSYIRAAPPQIAIPLYESFIRQLRRQYAGKIETGQFGAEMEVCLTNDGPVTIIIDSKNKE
ncbi:MAG: D-aminoacyl-tRNA deacylase [Bacteroidetes bacterium]|nr:D-aminoacyl-tRNA deacylase [Bacteroidota bacterium]